MSYFVVVVFARGTKKHCLRKKLSYLHARQEVLQRKYPTCSYRSKKIVQNETRALQNATILQPWDATNVDSIVRKNADGTISGKSHFKYRETPLLDRQLLYNLSNYCSPLTQCFVLSLSNHWTSSEVVRRN